MNLFKKLKFNRLLKTASQKDISPQTIKAIKSLGKMNEPEALSVLLSALENNHSECSIAAAEALGDLGHARAIHDLKNHIGDKNNLLRLMCAVSLHKLGEKKWKALIQGDDKDFQRLAGSNDPQMVKILIEAFCRDQNILAKEAIYNSKNQLVNKSLRDSLKFSKSKIPIINILGDLKDYQATQQLIDYSGDSDKSLRIAAINTIGRIGDTRAIEPLLNLLADRDVQKVVTRVLIRIGVQSVIESLISKLVDLKLSTRVLAASNLARLGEPKWEKIIRGNQDDFKRLGETGDQRFFIPLVKLLESSTCRERPELKCAVINGLAALKNPECKELLINTLLHTSKDIRKVAAEALFTLGEPVWANLIKGNNQDFEKLAESKQPMSIELIVRFLNEFKYERLNDEYKLAERALEKAYHSEALEKVIKALAAGNSDSIRSNAAKALGKMGNPIAIAPLVKTLKNDKNEDVRICAALALGNIGDPASINILKVTLTEASGELRKASSKALSKLGDPFWEKLIKGDDKDFSRLGSDGCARAVELLIAMIRRYSQSKQDLGNEIRLARTALEEVNNPDALDTLIKVLSDKKLQAPTIKALGGIGDLRSVKALLGLWDNLPGHGNSLLIEALARIGDFHAVEGLTGRLEDGLNKVSIEIIEVLGEIDDVELVIKSLLALENHEILQKFLFAPSGTLRKSLAMELAKSGDPFWDKLIKGDYQDFTRLATCRDMKGIDLLFSMIKVYSQRKHTLFNELELAREALADINNPKALDRLIKALYDDNMQDHAVKALGEIRDSKAVAPLLHLWESATDNSKSIIIDALVKIGDKTAIDGLMGPLIFYMGDDPDRIIDALGETDKKLAIEALVDSLSHPNIYIRKPTAKVLIRIAGDELKSSGPFWKVIGELIRNPHSDFVEGQSCAGGYEHYDSRVHTDTGIGLEIPPELRENNNINK